MHEPLCEVLLEKLCSAVQKVQELYASGQETIKDCEPVNQLCQVVDEVFSHGLREKILTWASGSETTYWPLVVKITYKEVLQSISRMPSVKTDRERCQVWVRIACQENSLGSYLNIVTQDEKLLGDFYQPHAFVFDKEKVDTAKTALLYGLSHLDFHISLDMPRSYQSSRTESFTSPKKCHTFNGTDSSYSSSFTYANSVTSSSVSSSFNFKGKDVSKKKKKVKSSVAVIADSLDDGVGVLNSVEKYLYNFSGKSHENSISSVGSLGVSNSEQIEDNLSLSHSNKMPLQRENNKSSKDSCTKYYDNKGETSNIMKTEQFSVQNNFHDTESIQSDQDFPSEEVSHCRSEEEVLEKLDSRVNNVLTEEENSKNDTEFRCTRDIETLECNFDNDFGPRSEKCPGNTSIDDNELSIQVNSEGQQTETVKKTVQQQEQNIHCNEYDYKVSRAHYIYGTPTEHCPLDDSKDENLSPEKNEEFNFVPGIHKDDPWRSQSGSFSSLTGSGSFSNQSKQETGELRRTSTIDSKSSLSSSVADSNVPIDLWKYVTKSFSTDVERKDSRADNMSIATDDSLGDFTMFEEMLGMTEDHFSSPESFLGLSSSEEFHHAIVSCKEMIKSTQNPDEKKKLVKQLIQLRIKQQEHKDESFTEKTPDTRKILGHQFIKEKDTKALSNVLCDRCGKWVWTIWQSLFTCQDCQFHSHRKCLDMIKRQCASRKVSTSSYSLNIAPENGLHAQQYKCVECRKMISLTKSGQGEARLCDYSGQYFCEDCHWNDQVVIPARIVHNWDFGTYKVSRQTKQFLDLMAKKPILDLDQLNPALFKFVGELRDIKRFREEILIMKKYFMSCRSALESKLLLHLQDRQHFVDNSGSYSLQDLLECERGTMLPFITKVHSLFLAHIKSDCELCRAKGFVCEICKANEIIFAFDPHAAQCTSCRTVFHRLCFKKDSCPKCLRIKQRKPK